MGLRKSTSPRRREVRRSLPRRGTHLPPWLNRRTVAWAVVFALGMAAFAWLIAPGIDLPQRYHLGQFVREAIVPRVEFKAVDPAVTAERRRRSASDEPAVYKQNTAYFVDVRNGLNSLLQIGDEYDNINQIPSSDVEDLKLDAAALKEFKAFNATEQARAQWQMLVDELIKELGTVALVRENRKEEAAESVAKRIEIVHPQLQPMTRWVTAILGTKRDVAQFRRRVTSAVSQGPGSFPAPIRNAVIARVIPGSKDEPKPTYLLDKEQTEKRRQEAFDDPSNEVETTYLPDQVLVAAGAKLDKTDLEVLRKEHEAYLRELGPQRLWLIRGGRFGVMVLIVVALWVYILAFNRKVSRNPLRGLAVTALMLLSQALAVFATGYKPDLVFAFATFPTLLVAIVLAISYDQRCALAMGAIHAVLVAVSLDLSVPFTIMLMVGLATGVALLTEVRTRSKLVAVGGWTGLAMAIAAILLTGLTDRTLAFPDGWQQLLNNALLALLSGVALGIFVQGILPVIESLFTVTTAMTLKELNDASRPLLRRLAEESPGTFQHSLRIADIAEAAADAIGCNGLLCRVGAMYHDVGKINKPRYFVENQAGGPNRHAKLSPAMSLLIIVGHVKDGMEMAREYGLPPIVRHFIESHHGTTLVEYFYHAAKQQRKDDANAPEPPEFAFRYPGPKPQTKEAAILMLCDGVEGAARTLPEQTPVRIEQLVHTMANKRLMDGQFDECQITLQDLHKIETALTRSLAAIYHSRISYPTAEEETTTEEAPPRPAAAS